MTLVQRRRQLSRFRAGHNGNGQDHRAGRRQEFLSPHPTDDERRISRQALATKADIFLHVDSKSLMTRSSTNEFAARMEPLLAAIAGCGGTIGTVHLYFSDAIVPAMHGFDPGTRLFHVPGQALENEQRAMDTVRWTYDRVADAMSRSGEGPRHDIPRLNCIGSRELARFVNSLGRGGPELIQNLVGSGYGAPKFVDAALRVARGIQAVQTPLLRLDADVIPDEAVLRQVLQAYEAEQARSRYFLFSGCYKGSGPHDDLNRHAVRTHFLQPADKPQFLRDLGEVGATQVGEGPCSPACQALVRRRGGISANRAVAQAISGAAWIESPLVARRTPPMSNCKAKIVWCDDHLRRLLHEVTGDVLPAATQRLPAALRQDRHPEGVSEADLAWAKNDYFARLTRGCLLQACIQGPTGQPGPLGDAVAQTLAGFRSRPLEPQEEVRLHDALYKAAAERFEEVITLWTQTEYGLITTWAREIAGSSYAAQLCTEVADDALAYLRLVLDWPTYVRALESLDPFEAQWLYARTQ